MERMMMIMSSRTRSSTRSISHMINEAYESGGIVTSSYTQPPDLRMRTSPSQIAHT